LPLISILAGRAPGVEAGGHAVTQSERVSRWQPALLPRLANGVTPHCQRCYYHRSHSRSAFKRGARSASGGHQPAEEENGSVLDGLGLTPATRHFVPLFGPF
jgi:hypothetical protein